MKLGKILYFLTILGFIVIGGVMIQNMWYIFGAFMGFLALTAIFLYLDAERWNRTYHLKTKRGRRAAYFKSLSEEEKEQYMINIEKQIKQSLKK